jgi:hypothetical protein
MVQNKLSSKEIDFILYIGQCQSDEGVVESVYYKDVCDNIDISTQKFYDILKSLKDKGLITHEKANPVDVRVTLCGNSFRDGDYAAGSEGYLKISENDFAGNRFRGMKAGSKLLFLYFHRFVNGKHMLIANFYSEFCKLFGIARKTLQIYLHELKKAKLMFVGHKRNKAYNYEITLRRSTVLVKKKFIDREKELYTRNVESLIKRNYGKYVNDEKDDKAVRDIASMTETKRATRVINFVLLVMKAIEDSILIQKREGKARPGINAALVNACLTDLIDRELLMGNAI